MTSLLLFIALCCCRRMVSKLLFDNQKNCCILCFLKMFFSLFFFFFEASYFCLWAKEPPSFLPACLLVWYAVGSASNVVAMAAMQSYDEPLDWLVKIKALGRDALEFILISLLQCCCFFWYCADLKVKRPLLSLCLLDPSFICFPKCSEHCVI